MKPARFLEEARAEFLEQVGYEDRAKPEGSG
jgi:hypothetical protein